MDELEYLLIGAWCRENGKSYLVSDQLIERTAISLQRYAEKGVVFTRPVPYPTAWPLLRCVEVEEVVRHVSMAWLIYGVGVKETWN